MYNLYRLAAISFHVVTGFGHRLAALSKWLFCQDTASCMMAISFCFGVKVIKSTV